MSAATVHQYARLLCAYIKLLKGVHRSGLTPSFSQVDDLFILADDLERVVETDCSETAKPQCTRSTCAAQSTCVVAGRPYCDSCADGIRKLLKGLEGFGFQAVRPNWPAPSRTGVDLGPLVED